MCIGDVIHPDCELELVDSGAGNCAIRLDDVKGMMKEMDLYGVRPEIVKVALEKGFSPSSIEFFGRHNLLNEVKDKLKEELDSIRDNYISEYTHTKMNEIYTPPEVSLQKYEQLKYQLETDLLKFLFEAAPVYEFDVIEISGLQNLREIIGFLHDHGFKFKLI